MDLGQTDDLDASIGSLTGSPPSRKRGHQPSDSDPGTEQKRAKARERQRRKRERDRAGMGVLSFADHSDAAAANDDHDSALSPEEQVKKDRVRIAARERQRKHRAVVKAKRMAEMGMQMAMEGAAGVAYHDGYAMHHQMHDGDPHNPLGTHPEPPYIPQPNQSPGQTFASIMLLSFSCTPLLKQHLLRQLSMTNEELAQFEPIIASAWDQWNSERSLAYARHPEHPSSPYHSNVGLPPSHSPYPPEHQQLHAEQASEFRNRFQRPVGPTGQFGQSSNHHQPIDPSLNNGADTLSVSDVRGKDEEENEAGPASPEIDPDLPSVPS